jgi:hypothetical protein
LIEDYGCRVRQPGGTADVVTSTLHTLVDLGASGDLVVRLVLPAVGQLLSSSEGPDRMTVVGART